jgi:hypothetical protein
MTRPICPSCKQRYKAIAYHKYNRIYYRSKCSQCLQKAKRSKPQKMRWQIDGYKKKPTCDKCGFRAKYTSQLLVLHVDGNQQNCDTRNLKTICLNCVQEIKKADLPWRPGDLEPDH